MIAAKIDSPWAPHVRHRSIASTARSWRMMATKRTPRLVSFSTESGPNMVLSLVVCDVWRMAIGREFNRGDVSCIFSSIRTHTRTHSSILKQKRMREYAVHILNTKSADRPFHFFTELIFLFDVFLFLLSSIFTKITKHVYNFTAAEWETQLQRSPTTSFAFHFVVVSFSFALDFMSFYQPNRYARTLVLIYVQCWELERGNKRISARFPPRQSAHYTAIALFIPHQFLGSRRSTVGNYIFL